MAQAGEAPHEPNWLPIESNPDVMNDYAQKLGWPIESYRFHDILALEDWALAMVPQPVLAVMMLFPIKEASEKHKTEEHESIVANGQVVSPSVYFAKQVVANACGTIGLLHACINASGTTGGPVALDPACWLSRFYSRTMSLDSDGRAEQLGEDKELEGAHTEQVAAGQSAVVDDTWNHFVCFVQKEGCLYELDGRKSFPINHGPCGGPGQPDLLNASADVIRAFMARDPQEVRFTMVALAAAGEEEQ